MRESSFAASANAPILCVIFATLLASSSPTTRAQEQPRETDYRDQVQVDLVQL